VSIFDALLSGRIGNGSAFRTDKLLLQAEDRLRLGAIDPLKKVRKEQRRERPALGLPTSRVKDVPIELLSSPAAREYAEAIRIAAEACRKMEEERGIEDGLAEILGDYAEIAALEVYGPVGLRGE
jgi:hypothetical protein